jgi:bacterioferritin (cytochrome b1)
MATRRSSSSSKSSGKMQSISRGDRGSRSRGKIDDVLYDVITVLHQKSKGLEAYDKYMQDVQNRDEVREVFEEIRQQDEEAVQRLEQCLRELIGGGEREEEEAA